MNEAEQPSSESTVACVTALPLYCASCRHYFVVKLPGRVVRVKTEIWLVGARGSVALGGTPCPNCGAADLWRVERV